MTTAAAQADTEPARDDETDNRPLCFCGDNADPRDGVCRTCFGDLCEEDEQC